MGRSIITLAIKDGYTHIFATENEENIVELDGFVQNLRDNSCICIETFRLDIKETRHIEEVVTSIFSSGIDIQSCVYTIGINRLCAAISLQEDEWDNVVDTNLKGFFFTSKYVASRMIKAKSGSIVAISSQHGVVGNVERAAYCASKSGMINLCRALAVEWGKYNIRVNIVSPTFIESIKNYEYLHSTRFVRENLTKIPLHRYATPDDVAYSILFLLSDKAKMITGHNLLVDGGWSAQ